MKRTRTALRILILATVVAIPSYGETVTSLAFDKAGWDASKWILVKSPRWDHFGTWVQETGHIRNTVPEGVSAEELLSKRAKETYSSMVYHDKVSGQVTIRATMAFDHRMAPLIVLAPELGKDARERPEYREHFEVVLFDEGVNVWHHTYRNGKPSWHKAAYARFPLKPNTPYTLLVRKTDRALHIEVDGHVFGYLDDSLPDTFYAGITGCEGVNRFYDFSLITE